MAHSIKEHLELGKIIKRKDNKIIFKSTFTGKPSSSCKKANDYLNSMSSFHKMIKNGNTNLCKTCTKKYEELLLDLIQLRKV
jgi:hypothetical protein